MKEPRLVGQNPPAYPFSSDNNELRRQLLDKFRYLIEDSVAFLGEELTALRLNPDQVRAEQQRIKRGLLSQWARALLGQAAQESIDYPSLLSDRDIGDFMEEMFG